MINEILIKLLDYDFQISVFIFWSSMTANKIINTQILGKYSFSATNFYGFIFKQCSLQANSREQNTHNPQTKGVKLSEEVDTSLLYFNEHH